MGAQLCRIDDRRDTDVNDDRFDCNASDTEKAEPLVIPHGELSADALQGVIESFVLREGTEYGEHDYSLEQKVAHVLRQLERGEARVVFDADTETVHIVVTRSLPARALR